MTDARISRRRVYHICGYDHARPDAVHGRLARELRRFESTWGVSAVSSEPVVGADLATWQVATTGPDWRVETEFRLLRWDDVVEAEAARPMWRRVSGGVLAFLDFVLAGALLRYLRTSWRYAMFFLYPFLILAAVGLFAFLGGAGMARATGSALAGLGVGIGVFVVLFRLAERLVFLGLLFDDWIFSRRYIRWGDPVLDDRLQRVALELAGPAHADAPDEIVIVAHSLGAVLAIDLLDRAIQAGLGQSDRTPRVVLLTVGSSTLKIGLHGAAARFRAAVARVSAARAVFWADYQARSDVMNFYDSDPLAEMGLPPTGSPLVRSVSIRRMLDPARYPRIRRNWYRMHCQFVRGNDRRAPYDYFMLTCGPFSAEQQARSQEGAMLALDSEGRISPSPAPMQNDPTEAARQ